MERQHERRRPTRLQQAPRIFAMTLLATALAACGGGGSGAAPPAPNPIPNPIPNPNPNPNPVPPPAPAPAPATDTDGDGLSDAQEATIGTSPILADTDGDGLDDNDEVTSGGFDPLVADIPKLSIEVIGAPTIQLDTQDTSSNTAAESYTASFAQGQQSSYSQTDTSATSATIEASTRVYSEAEVSGGITGPSGSAKAGVEASVSASATVDKSTSVTSASARDSRQEFGRLRSAEQSGTRVVTGGSLQATLRIRNVSDLTFELSRVEVIAKRFGADSETFQPIGTLRIELPTPQELANGQEIQQIVTTDSASADLLRELMANPSGLQFTVANYVLDRVGNEDGRSFARLNQDVSAQTAQVVIDYGASAPNGVDTVEQFMVATNVDRDPVSSEPLGVPMSRVLGEILALPYAVQNSPVLDGNGQDTGQQKDALSSVRGVASGASVRDGFWYVFSSSDSLDEPTTDFDDIVLKPRDRISLVYLRDSDGDRIFDREEFLLGTNLQSDDSDGDGLTDFEEAKQGWFVNVDGDAREVFSDPLNDDVDGDGLSDAQERAAGTDPNAADTDGDGTDDDVDPDPTGVSVLDIDVSYSGPTRRIEANGDVVPPTGESVTEVEIDWGDGLTPTTLTPAPGEDFVQIRNVFRTYSADGSYTITLTARTAAGGTETRTNTVTLRPRTTADIGGMLFDDGWDDARDTRYALDLNQDGRVDLIGFGPDGTWVALANGTGFDDAARISTDFASGTSFDKARQRRQLANVGGNAAPDIVHFAADGVYVALNQGDGTFGPATRWIEAFGSGQGYPNLGEYPRDLGRVNGDTFDDIVGFSGNGPVLAVSDGSSFTFLNNGNPVQNTFGRNAGNWDVNNQRILGDFNGDGFVDFVGFGDANTFFRLNDRAGGFSSGSTISGYTQNGGWLASRHIRQAIDLDGETGDDLIGFANSITVANYSEGDSITPSQTLVSEDFAYNDGWRLGNDPRYLVDLNGDGFPDIVGFGPVSTGVPGGVYYALNRGVRGEFTPRTLWLAEFGTNQGTIGSQSVTPRFAGDVDGDGNADLIVLDRSEVTVVFSADVD